MAEQLPLRSPSLDALAAIARLLDVAKGNSGQSARVSNFLLAWHNAEENGGWDPVDLWQLDTVIVRDIFTTLSFIAVEQKYPNDLGFDSEIADLWKRTRGRPAR